MELDVEHLISLIRNKHDNVEGYTVTELIKKCGHDRSWWSGHLKTLIEAGICKCVGQREVKTIGYEFTGRMTKVLVFTFMERDDESE